MTFGDVLEALKGDKRAARSGWNGKGMFIFMRPGDTLDNDFILTVRSLPQSVRVFLHSLNKPIGFNPYLCMFAADGTIVNGWLASQTDMIADDWEILA